MPIHGSFTCLNPRGSHEKIRLSPPPLPIPLNRSLEIEAGKSRDSRFLSDQSRDFREIYCCASIPYYSATV
jgi:hypothetical protein